MNNQAKFSKFHEDNPEVYKALVRLAREYKSRGRTKMSIELLINVFRWFHVTKTTDADYKINNNYKAKYARLIMAQEPDLANLFNIREARNDHL